MTNLSDINLIDLKRRVGELRQILYQADERLFEKEIFNEKSRLNALQRRLNKLETQKPGFFARFKKSLNERRSELIDIQSEIEAVGAAIQNLVKDSNDLDGSKKDFENSLRSFKKKAEAFRHIYHYRNAMIDRKERRLAVSAAGDVYSMSTEKIKHVYCIGGTGSGKSKLLESMMIQDIIAGRGGCLIDPFGNLFREVAGFCYFYEELRRDIKAAIKEFEALKAGHKNILPAASGNSVLQKMNYISSLNIDEIMPSLNFKVIDISKRANSKENPNPYRINPFELLENEEVHERVDTLMKSIQRHTDQSAEETPRLTNIMKALFSYMILARKSLPELDDVKKFLIGNAGTHKDGSLRIPDDFLKKLKKSDNITARQGASSLEFLLRLPRNDFINSFDSLNNRVPMLNNEVNSRLLYTQKTTLNLKKEINSADKNGRRPFLLFNIPVNEPDSAMTGTFLLTQIDRIMFDRTAEEQKLPFFVYVDEFYKFVDDELAERFAQTRQYGLGYVIAHQNLAQLRRDDPTGFRLGTILSNTSVRLVMSVEHEAAKHMTENSFRVTGTMEKKSFTTSEGRNEVVGYNLSQTRGSAKSRSTTKSSSESDNWSRSFSKTAGKSVSKAIGTSSSVTEGTSSSRSKGKNFSRSDGHSSSTTESSGRSYGNSSSSNSSRQIPSFASSSLDAKTTSGSVIGSSSQQNSGHAYTSGTHYSETTGENESETFGQNRSETEGRSRTDTTARSESETEGRSEGGARTTGRSEQEGISENFAKTYGRSLSLGDSSSKSVKTEFLGVEEERQLLAQEIQALAPRELFVCFPQLTTYKAATFDSLIIQLSEKGYLGHLEGDNFYPCLLKAQAGEREKMKKLLESKRPPKDDDLKTLEDGENKGKKNGKKKGGKNYKGEMF